jgi:hypothetical protein
MCAVIEIATKKHIDFDKFDAATTTILTADMEADKKLREAQR